MQRWVVATTGACTCTPVWPRRRTLCDMCGGPGVGRLLGHLWHHDIDIGCYNIRGSNKRAWWLDTQGCHVGGMPLGCRPKPQRCRGSWDCNLLIDASPHPWPGDGSTIDIHIMCM